MDEQLFYDLYFGNYRPAEEYPTSPELKACEDKVANLREHLKKTLPPDTLEIFLQLDDEQLGLSDLYESRAFAQGMQLATRIIFSALTGRSFPSENK